jgi:hypothetical protein
MNKIKYYILFLGFLVINFSAIGEEPTPPGFSHPDNGCPCTAPDDCKGGSVWCEDVTVDHKTYVFWKKN